MQNSGASETPIEQDPGLARERTDLAWNRSGLAAAVTVAIVLRRLWPLHGDREALAMALIAAAAVIWVVGMRLGRRMGRTVGAHGVPGESTCRMVTIGTLLLAASGFVAGIL
jgi:VIT1/CCC1 family predicted Fe2+/Mn2+ transporter